MIQPTRGPSPQHNPILPNIRLLVLAAGALTTAVACDPGPEPAATCRSQQGLTASNAITVNGIGINGLQLNGLHLNGTKLQGANLNALTLNRLALNGATLQGHRLQGAKLQGESLNDALAVQGVVVDTDLEHRLTGGMPAAGEQLIAVSVAGWELPLTIAGEEERDGLRHLRVALADGTNPCGSPDAEGLIVPGVWNLETGARQDAMQVGDRELRYTFSCAQGVIAKCVAWGYDPNVQGTDVHQTCTRLARADYCGDGVATTENGTEIDVYDGLGILEPDGGKDFEAGWGPDGAVCVSHPRYLDVVEGEGPVYPKCWDALPRCEDLASAEEHGALLVNASIMQQRLWCSEPDLAAR